MPSDHFGREILPVTVSGSGQQVRHPEISGYSQESKPSKGWIDGWPDRVDRAKYEWPDEWPDRAKVD